MRYCLFLNRKQATESGVAPGTVEATGREIINEAEVE